ncbi:uncharacterized protein [Choristoneura fumiferana]|uniref:uncharacterized protein n=1 Tax=Choristoneura fumiferana TaxID=7141 RepID=UPI003D15A130
MLKFIFVLVLFGHSTCYGDTSESDWRSRGWYRPRRNYPSQSQSQNAFGIRTGAFENQKPETSSRRNQGSFGNSFNQRQTSSPFGDLGQKYQTQNEGTSYNQNSKRNPFQSNGLQSQTTSFGTNNAQNYQNGKTFGAKNSGSSLENDFNSNAQIRNLFETSFSNSKLNYAQNIQNQNSFGFGVQPRNQNSFRTSKNQNSFGNSFMQNTQNQNAFRANYNQQAQTQNSFLSYQNAQSQSAFGSYSQSAQRQSTFGSSFAQNPFPYQNVTNNFNIGSFGRGENIFKGPDYLPPYIAPGYLPSKDPTTTTRRPFYTTTTTRRPFYTTSTTRRPFYTTTTTRRPYYTTTTTRRPFYTTSATTTTRRPFITTTHSSAQPAMAMSVPLELEDEPTTPKPSTPFYEESSTLDELKFTGLNEVDPASAMRVPLELEDEPTTPKPSTPFDEESSTLDEMKVTRLNQVAPAMAMRVSPEPEPDPTPITTTTTTPRPTTTTTTTPPPTTTTTTTTPRPTTTTTTITTTPRPTTTTTTTTTPRPTTTTTTTTTPRPTTTTTTTTPRPTTTTTTTTTPRPTTTTTTTTTTPRPTTTTTTTTTPRPTTTTTTTTTPRPTTTTTTTTTTPRPTTTTTTTTTPRPTTTTTTTTTPRPTTTTTTTPRPTTTTTTTTSPTTTTPASTTPDPNRMLVEETPKTTTTKVPPFNLYKAPKYLPPENTTSVPPSPAMAVPVPSEPECDPLDPKTYPYPLVIGIDERAAQDPCTYVPVRTTTKKPFVGPGYLPPVAARVGRSPKTLRLGDVEGARPVWHVGLYTKTTAPYKQICGGSIVRMDVVITAAHCVWNDDTLLEPAENYAVGGNKIYRPWTEPHDKRAQQSDIREIIVPPRYRGGKTSFQDDIAILRLVTPFSYARGLRPVCVSFDDDFDAEQLSEGNSGTVAGWGYTDDIGSPTQFLLWLELPYVDIEKCIAGADDAFLKYITSDKICAGENHTGKALCKGDSGGGLVFWHSEGDLVTPYLRGVASASARADNKECNVNVVGGFTQVTAHRRFLQQHVPDIDQNCRYHYFN